MRCEGREGLHRERHQVRRKRLLQHRSARRELLDGSDLWIERQQRIYRFRRFCRLVAFLRELPAQRRVGTPTQYDLLPALAHAFVGRRFLLQIQPAPTNPRARQMSPLHVKTAQRVSGVARMHGNVGSSARPCRVACAATPGRLHGNTGSPARPRRVACTASPGRRRGLAKAVSTFGHFSGIRESITQKTERKQQVDSLPFHTFALDTQQPRNQVPKS